MATLGQTHATPPTGRVRRWLSGTGFEVRDRADAKQALAAVDATLAQVRARRAAAAQRLATAEAETLGAHHPEATARRRLDEVAAALT